MNKIIIAVAICAVIIGAGTGVAQTAPRSVEYDGKTYYVVTSTDRRRTREMKFARSRERNASDMPVSRTKFTKANPSAATKSDMNGSKAVSIATALRKGRVRHGKRRAIFVRAVT